MLTSFEGLYCMDWKNGKIPRVSFINDTRMDLDLWWLCPLSCADKKIPYTPPYSCTAVITLPSNIESFFYFRYGIGYLIVKPSFISSGFYFVPVLNGESYTYKQIVKYADWESHYQKIIKKLAPLERKHKNNQYSEKKLFHPFRTT